MTESPPASAASHLGPVSTALEADLRSWVRRHGIAYWLDLDDHYTSFVEQLRARRAGGELPYEVFAYRGSHLELMLALEAVAGGTEKTPLVIHLPGFNEERVKASPVLELCEAGSRYRKAMATLVREAAAGQVTPDAIEQFSADGELTLDRADAWLAAALDSRSGGLAAQLRGMSLNAIVDDLLAGGAIAGQLAIDATRETVVHHLEAATGLPSTWRDASAAAGSERADTLAYTVAGWAMAVEYVDDLQRDPIDARLVAASSLPRAVIDGCRALALHLRERHADFYQRTADDTEAGLQDEIDKARAEDLGDIDTFRFEENVVLDDALAAIGAERWDDANTWAKARLDGRSFWLGRDPARRSSWQLVETATRLGLAIRDAGDTLGKHGDLASAVDVYCAKGAVVDEAHRHLEQRRKAMLLPQLPEFEILRERLDGLRRLWRRWADSWARDFNALCRTHGFLPEASYQQRTLFDDVVRPMAQEGGTTALFVVDALRYEMGAELHRALAGTSATTVQLRARLAELPTVTEVGMNVLAPVAHQGRLRMALRDGAIKGFSTGEFRVMDPKTRQRAMADRVGGATCPWLSLDEVLSRDTTSLKKAVARAELMIVHSEEIDRVGEKGDGPVVFENALQKLKAGWHLLRDAGVRRFVITADHGFLLLDDSVGGAQRHGRKIDPKRRHVISTVGADHTGEVRVPLAELGYDDVEGHLMFPETVAPFDTGRHQRTFVHGGNSLQERVIPVLTLVHRSDVGGSTLRYVVEVETREGVAGMHCVAGKLVASEGSLGFGGPSEVALALRAVDAPNVQVDLCQTRDGARLHGGTLMAKVGESFELFFRLSGGEQPRVAVEMHHAAKEVEVASCIVAERFAVAATTSAPEMPAASTTPESSRMSWLDELDDPGVRRLFEHLSTHGAVTEAEAANLLGSQRAVRRFALQFESHAARAPFNVRIDVVAGVKRYVREGNAS